MHHEIRQLAHTATQHLRSHVARFEETSSGDAHASFVAEWGTGDQRRRITALDNPRDGFRAEAQWPGSHEFGERIDLAGALRLLTGADPRG
ncbi:MAG TPA: hypothetical protein VKZ89_05190 [Thermobifida alba]|nr:hypothetical protein [Thermobifida alba]